MTYSSSSEDPTVNQTKPIRTITWTVTDANSDGVGAAVSRPVLTPSTATTKATIVSYVGTPTDPQGNEGVGKAVDGNTGSKYLNFDKFNTGLMVTLDSAHIIQALKLTTANDVPARDPGSFSIYGSNTSQSSGYTLIANQNITLPDTRGTTTRFEFSNSTTYLYYKVIFPTLKNAGGANSMQIAEVELQYDASGSTGGITSTITLTAVNDEPVRSGSLSPISVAEDYANSTAVSLGLTGITYGVGGGSDEASQTLTYTITNIPSQLTLWKNDGTTSVTTATTGLTLDDMQGLKYKTVANANGTGTLTWTVTDSGSNVSPNDNVLSQSLAVRVTAENDAPTLTSFSSTITTNEDTPVAVTLENLLAQGNEADVDGSVTAFVVKALSSGTLLINGANWDATTNNTINASKPARWTPASNANGTLSAFTLVAKDDSGAESSTEMQVQVAVTAVNDVPSFTMGANQTINEDAGAQTVSLWATNLSIGPSNEASQALNFIVSNSNNSLFSVQPTVNASGTLAYTPASNAYGLATVTVQAHDNGGTANSGSDTSAAQTFTITANPINDKPVLNAGTGYLRLNGSTDLRANIDEPETGISREIVFRTTVGGGLFEVNNNNAWDRSLLISKTSGQLYSRVYSEESIHGGRDLRDGLFHTILFTLGSSCGKLGAN